MAFSKLLRNTSPVSGKKFEIRREVNHDTASYREPIIANIAKFPLGSRLEALDYRGFLYEISIYFFTDHKTFGSLLFSGNGCGSGQTKQPS